MYSVAGHLCGSIRLVFGVWVSRDLAAVESVFTTFDEAVASLYAVDGRVEEVHEFLKEET